MVTTANPEHAVNADKLIKSAAKLLEEHSQVSDPFQAQDFCNSPSWQEFYDDVMALAKQADFNITIDDKG